jgi:CheY-like chemotaxis protein
LEILTSWGLKAEVFENSAPALEAIARTKIAGGTVQLIIRDNDVCGDFCSLKGTGVCCVAQRAAGAPLVVLSSLRDRQSGGGLVSPEVVAYLVKPFRQRKLFDAVYAILSGQSTQRMPNALVLASHTSLLPSPTPVEPGQRRVLVAEDNAVNRKLATKMLEKLGCVAELAVDGREAIEKWRGGDFRVVLMDVQMPVVDGFDATRSIRELERGSDRRTYIVAMTANAMQGDRERCIEAGMDDYVPKPVDINELRRAIDAAFGSGGSKLKS